jgi:hypothetical protein
MKNPCNKCKGRMAVRTFDAEPLCESCTMDRLIEVVEALTTGYITVTAELRYEK